MKSKNIVESFLPINTSMLKHNINKKNITINSKTNLIY